MRYPRVFLILAGLSAFSWGLPAFPGAEGWGANARGGRSGAIVNNRAYDTRVLHVTNLNSSGPGSLLAALSVGGPRIVVFDVSGVIDMKEANIIINSYCYVAGQTSPGGITMVHGGILAPPAVTDATLFTPTWKCTQDIIIRFIRGRSSRYWGGDDNLHLEGCREVIVDHCSFDNCCDEIVDAAFSYNMTFSWCFITESNVVCGGEVNRHGLLSHQTNRQSLLHSFLSHHDSRTPLFSNCYTGTCVPGSGPFEIVNNILYNCSASQTFVNNQESSNIVGNYVKGGTDYAPAAQWDGNSNMKIHVEGNYHANNPSQGQQAFIGGTANWQAQLVPPANFSNFTSGQQAFTDFKAKGGALPRDSCDRRLIRELETGAGKVRVLTAQEESQQSLIPRDVLTLAKITKPSDRDNDGMPDYWEANHGLNPDDPADIKTPMNGGYDAIEVYVNELADTLIATGGRWPSTWIEGVPGRAGVASELCAAPNPFRSSVMLRLPAVSDQGRVRIFDANGRLAAEFKGVRQSAIRWNPESAPAGVYLVEAEIGGKIFRGKIISTR